MREGPGAHKQIHDISTEVEALRDSHVSASSDFGAGNCGKRGGRAFWGASVPSEIGKSEGGLWKEEQTQTSKSPFSELSASGLLQRIPLEDIEQQASWQAGRPYPEIFLGASTRNPLAAWLDVLERMSWVLAL